MRKHIRMAAEGAGIPATTGFVIGLFAWWWHVSPSSLAVFGMIAVFVLLSYFIGCMIEDFRNPEPGGY